MVIEDRTVVTLNYRLTTNEDGKEVEIEKTSMEQPFVFLYGNGHLLPEFEKNLLGKSVGDTFDFYISAENGYGINDEKNVVLIPLNVFVDKSGKPDTLLLRVGNTLPMKDKEGNTYEGTIKEITDEDVLMDFNHPLAGKELHFTGDVVAVRLATLEELQHGHVHGAGGHHH